MFDGDIAFYSDAAAHDLGDGRVGPDHALDALNDSAAERWLVQLCSTVPSIEAALLELRHAETHRQWAWGCSRGSDQDLESALRKARDTQQPVFERLRSVNDTNASSLLAIPITVLATSNSRRSQHGAVGLTLNTDDERQLQTAAELVSRNLGWLDLLMSSDTSHRSGNADHIQHLLESVNAHAMASSNGLNLATEFAALFACNEVTIGAVQMSDGPVESARQTRIIAISGFAEFDRRRQRVSTIAAAMAAHAQQVGDSAATVWVFDPTKTDNESMVDSALSRLARNAVCASILAKPANGPCMVMICEWPLDKPPSTGQLEEIERAATLLLPILATQLAAEPGIVSRAIKRTRAVGTILFGAGHPRAKLLVAIFMLAAFVLSLAEIEFRISAPMKLEGATQRAISAPFDGFVQAAHVTPGMRVKQGTPLVEFDVSGLELQINKWTAERAKLRREYDKALSELDHAAARILRAQIQQAEAELQLVESKLARTKLTAPFDGVVIKGDLSRSIGAPFERGEVLMELAPLDGYRVVLSVDERDVHTVSPGQTGELTLSAMPTTHWPFVVKMVASAAPDDNGVHRFRVEAALKNPSDQLRPGMQGIGKILVGDASPAYIASRRFIGWLRLNLWARLP